MSAALCAALALAAIALASAGLGKAGTGIALRLTGRLTLLFFWPAYAGAATAALFGPRFGILARHRRNFGLAYASAQLVHFALVGRIIALSDRLNVEAVMPFFAVGVVWTGVLALSSVARLGNLFSLSFWRILRNIGLEYIALVFFADLVLTPIRFQTHNQLEYLPFAILIIVGAILRLAASARHLGPWNPAAIGSNPTSSR